MALALGVLLAALVLTGCQEGSPAMTTGADGAPSIEALLDEARPLNIAHAGGDAAHPHSTLFGYGESVAEGADVLELDVQLSADGVLVVHHDETLDRTTEANGPVVERSRTELQALDAGYRWTPDDGETFPYRGVRIGERPPPTGYSADDFAIPTLRQVAERFPALPLDIEIKGEQFVDPLDVARALAEELSDLDRVESSVVVSFASAVVQAFHDLAPEVAVSPGLGELTAWFAGGRPLAEQYSLIQIPPSTGSIEVLSADLVRRAEAEGLDVWVWAASVDQEQAETYGEWLDLGVDGIIAGRPAEMSEARSARQLAGSNESDPTRTGP